MLLVIRFISSNCFIPYLVQLKYLLTEAYALEVIKNLNITLFDPEQWARLSETKAASLKLVRDKIVANLPHQELTARFDLDAEQFALDLYGIFQSEALNRQASAHFCLLTSSRVYSYFSPYSMTSSYYCFQSCKRRNSRQSEVTRRTTIIELQESLSFTINRS